MPIYRRENQYARLGAPIWCGICADNDISHGCGGIDIPHTVEMTQPIQVFVDAEGRRHVHDHNEYGTAYSCTNGHRWTVHLRLECPIDECEEHPAQATFTPEDDA